MFTLQHVVFTSDLGAECLYWKKHEVSGACSVDARPTDIGRGWVRLDEGQGISLNTYFNSFYESFWYGRTALKKLAFQVTVEGKARITINRLNLLGDRLVLVSRICEGTGGVHLFECEGPRFHGCEVGRLYIEIEALEGGATCRDAAWICHDAPLQKARFDAVFCTFNREPFLGPSCERLLDYAPIREAMPRIVITNQGTAKLQEHPAFAFLKDEAKAARLHIVDQPNYGGSGGFTRGVMEMLQAGQATHALLMDDDAQIEPECVYRAYAFACMAKDTVAIGGQMLDLVRPHMLFESANTVRLNRLTIDNPVMNTDLGEEEGVNLLMEPQIGHYNAWWFCAIPRGAFERFGLPLPMFIRGDDIEFGLRMRAGGMLTIALPGVAVLHEPFYLKPGGFKEYYIVRNMLVNSVLHARVSPWQFLPVLWVRFFMHALRFDYAQASLTCRGIADFLKGPGFLTHDGAQLHRDVTSGMKNWATEVLLPIWVSPAPHAELKFEPKPVFLWKIMLMAIFNLLFPVKAKANLDPSGVVLMPAMTLTDRWVLSRRAFANRLVISHPYEPKSFVYQRDWPKFMALLSAMLTASVQLLVNYTLQRGKWQRESRSLTSMAFWQSYLKLGHKVAAAADKNEQAKAA